eukprot:2139832-Rhodomonas_salina.1
MGLEAEFASHNRIQVRRVLVAVLVAVVVALCLFVCQFGVCLPVGHAVLTVGAGAVPGVFLRLSLIHI